MFVCTRESYRNDFTPWGKEVKRILGERGMMQKDLAILVAQEIGKPYFDKNRLSETLRGVGVNARWREIHAVNKILGIPEDVD
jgi:hypothetical protein